MARGGPWRPWSPHASTMGTACSPGLSRPDGGSAQDRALEAHREDVREEQAQDEDGDRDADVGEDHRPHVDG